MFDVTLSHYTGYATADNKGISWWEADGREHGGAKLAVCVMSLGQTRQVYASAILPPPPPPPLFETSDYCELYRTILEVYYTITVRTILHSAFLLTVLYGFFGSSEVIDFDSGWLDPRTVLHSTGPSPWGLPTLTWTVIYHPHAPSFTLSSVTTISTPNYWHLKSKHPWPIPSPRGHLLTVQYHDDEVAQDRGRDSLELASEVGWLSQIARLIT